MKAACCEETFFSLKMVLFIYLTRLSVAQDCAASNIKMISDWNGCEMTWSLRDLRYHGICLQAQSKITQDFGQDIRCHDRYLSYEPSEYKSFESSC